MYVPLVPRCVQLEDDDISHVHLCCVGIGIVVAASRGSAAEVSTSLHLELQPTCDRLRVRLR